MEQKEPSLNETQLESLLKLTSRRLGTTPDVLKQAAQSGDLSQVMGEQSQAVQRVLSDPEAAKKLLSTPQAQKLFELLQKNDK